MFTTKQGLMDGWILSFTSYSDNVRIFMKSYVHLDVLRSEIPSQDSRLRYRHTVSRYTNIVFEIHLEELYMFESHINIIILSQ